MYSRSFGVFVFVGGSAALGYFVLACTLKYFGMAATMASAIAYLSFVPISYLGHRKFTFNSAGNAAVELPKFLVVAFLGIATGVLVPHLVTDVSGLPAWIGFALVCAVVPIVSYVSLRIWVFRQRQSEPWPH